MSVSRETRAGCIFERPNPACSLVHLNGELDAATVPPLEEQIAAHLASGSEQVILDLTGVSFIDSTGIRMLIRFLSRRGSADGVTLVMPHTEAARRALEIVGIRRVVTVADSLDGIVPPTIRLREAA